MKRLRIALTALVVLVLGGCGGDSIQSPDFTQKLLRLSIAGTPAVGTPIPVGRTQQFTAQGEYSLPPGSRPATELKPVEDDVVWSSSNPSVATIDPITGLATAVGTGTTTITAEGDGESGTAQMVVVAPVVDRLVITCNGAPTECNGSLIPVDGTVTLTARAVLSNGQSSDVQATWSSSSTPNVTVSSAGPADTVTATAIAQGSSTITARAADDPTRTDTLVITVRPRIIDLTIAPDPGVTPLGRPLQFVATGTLKRSQTLTQASQTINSGLQWSVANNPLSQGGSTATVATIDPDSGIANGLRVGTATVTAVTTSAIEGGVSDTAALQITPPVIDRLVISPANPSVCVGFGRELRANAVLTNGQSIGQRAQWSVTPANLLTFSPNPAAVTSAVGQTVGTGTISVAAVDANGAAVTDSSGTPVTASTSVTVTAQTTACIPENAVLRVEPATATVRKGGTVQFRAVVEDALGNDLTVPATWASSDTAIATVNPTTGVATGEMESPNAVTITATANVPDSSINGDTATATLTVTGEVCTTPLRAVQGVTPLVTFSEPCQTLGLGPLQSCAVNNPNNFIDEDPESFTSIVTALGLLGGAETRLRAQTSNITSPPRSYPFPFPGGDNAGFVIARPVGSLVLAEVGAQIQVRTLRNGQVQEFGGRPQQPPVGGLLPLPLRVDVLGLAVNGQYEFALASIPTTTEYDAIELAYNAGVATVSTLQPEVLVFQACGTAEPPQLADLVQVERIEPTANDPLVVDGTRDYTLIGRYSNGTVGPIPDADIDWTITPVNGSVATIQSNGLVTGVAPGTATVTGTLKPGVTVTGGNGVARSASKQVTVIANICTDPLLASDTPAASISRTINGICLLCSTSNLPNVIDDVVNTFGSLNVPVGLLNGGVSVTVNANRTISPAAGNVAGFIISRTSPAILTAELASQIVVETLLNGVVVSNSTEALIPLRLGLLGVDLAGGAEQILVRTPAASQFDAVRLTFNSGVLTADLDQLNNLNVFRACASVATLP